MLRVPERSVDGTEETLDSLCHALVEQVRHPVDRALVMTLANLLRLEVLDELDRRENPRIYAALESGGGC